MIDKPKICIVGCGAIGGLLAAHLSTSGADVHVIDRGKQLAAIQANGLTLLSAGGEPKLRTQVSAGESFNLPPQDFIFLAVKSHQLAEIASQLHPMIKPETAIVSLQNGLPWWYFQRHGGALDGTQLTSTDPGGIISSHICKESIIGCIAYPAATLCQPGVIRHIEGLRFPIGELDGSRSSRCETLSQVLTNSGLKSPILEDIRSEIWLKLWGASAFNPLSMLTGTTMAEICRNPSDRSRIIDMMCETEQVANKLGIVFRVGMDKRLSGAERVGNHKTSTLQDLEAGRKTELEAILGSVIEAGQLGGIDTPSLSEIYGRCAALESTA